MLKLTILSRRALRYEQLVTPYLDDSIQICCIEKHTLSDEQAADTECLLADPDLAAQVVDKCPKLIWLQSTWAGVETLTQHSRADYQLTGVKEVFGKRMREYVMAHLLEDVRNIPGFVQLQTAQTWAPKNIDYLYTKTLGIMGLGNIGMQVAKLAKALDMRVLGFAQQTKPCDFVDHCFVSGQQQAFAQQLDYLLLLLPHTESTTDLINTEFLQWLPQTCLLINAGRGNAIDEDALCKALHQGQIRGAVLDVFKQEPLPQGHPFWTCPNLHITQHTAAITSSKEVAEIFLRNSKKLIENQTLDYLIDFSKGY